MAAPSPSGRHQSRPTPPTSPNGRFRGAACQGQDGPPCHPATTKISISAAASLINTRGANGAAACQRGRRSLAPTRRKVEGLRRRPAQGGQAESSFSSKNTVSRQFHSQCRAAWWVAASLHECSCFGACVEGFATALGNRACRPWPKADRIPNHCALTDWCPAGLEARAVQTPVLAISRLSLAWKPIPNSSASRSCRRSARPNCHRESTSDRQRGGDRLAQRSGRPIQLHPAELKH